MGKRTRVKSLHKATGAPPFAIHRFAVLRSTSEQAKRMIAGRRLVPPAIVYTRRQTAGRGRGSNAWYSPPGALTATFVMRCTEACSPVQLSLLWALTIRNAIEEATGKSPQLKWPNDLIWEDRKLGGILCERIHDVDLIGVGVNLGPLPNGYPREIRKISASVSEMTTRQVTAEQLTERICSSLQQLITRARGNDVQALLREFDAHHMLINRKVRVTNPINGVETAIGICRGIDAHGRLRVSTKLGETPITSGHVVLYGALM